MLEYRKITSADDKLIANIIRKNLEKVHLDILGTAYYDSELEQLSSYYNTNPDKRCYFIALDNKRVVGGVGIAEFNAFEDCAEMQKLYLSDEVKGKGYSKELVSIAENWAKAAGYKKLYLETHSKLVVAIKLYEKLGFKEIERPKTALHCTMDRFYLKTLK